VWDAALGEPYVSRFLVKLDGCRQEKAYDRDLVAEPVQKSCALAVANHQLETGTYTGFRIMAYKSRRSSAPLFVAPLFELEPLDTRLDIADVDTGRLHTIDERSVDEFDDFTRYISNDVFVGIEKLARQTPDREIGGLLLGQLVRSSRTRDLCLKVNDFIEVCGNPSQTSFEFRPEDFVEVDRICALRHQTEMIVGWYHSHPFFCARCPDERRRLCPFRVPVFSAADRDVHKTLFPGSWAIGLLHSSFGASGEFTVYGWRQALIRELGYQLVEVS
jgi:proteasome lid subunit RPN8/RPN11